ESGLHGSAAPLEAAANLLAFVGGGAAPDAVHLVLERVFEARLFEGAAVADVDGVGEGDVAGREEPLGVGAVTGGGAEFARVRHFALAGHAAASFRCWWRVLRA